MEKPFEEMNQYELLKLRDDLIKKRTWYEDDIIDTQDAIEDCKYDYVTRKDYENDITYDKGQISTINDELDIINSYLSKFEEKGKSLVRNKKTQE